MFFYTMYYTPYTIHHILYTMLCDGVGGLGLASEVRWNEKQKQDHAMDVSVSKPPPEAAPNDTGVR